MQNRLPIQTLQPNFKTEWNYSVHFVNNAFKEGSPGLIEALTLHASGQDRWKLMFFIDDGVSCQWPDLINQIQQWASQHDKVELISTPEVLPGGEACKHGLTNVEKALNVLASNNVDRHSYVVAIGGGAFLDMIGFATAICHRGIRMIRMPSTVLGQNDAGIGVKNGVNYQGQKNFLGCFTVPIAVVNDLSLLQSLEARDKRSGVTEAIKVALLKEPEFFDWIYEHRQKLAEFDSDVMAQLIFDCARLHVEQIAHGGDPFETGNQRPLDFGHWVAHRLEILSHHNIRHGEAVAVGIALDLAYSVSEYALSGEVLEQYYQICDCLGFDLCPQELLFEEESKPAIFKGLQQFREHLGGKLSIPMLSDVGTVVDANEIDESLYYTLVQQLYSRGKLIA